MEDVQMFSLWLIYIQEIYAEQDGESHMLQVLLLQGAFVSEMLNFPRLDSGISTLRPEEPFSHSLLGQVGRISNCVCVVHQGDPLQPI